VKVKPTGNDYFERFRLQERTIDELIHKIGEKFPGNGEVKHIINVPDVAVTDTEGVKCLKDDEELLITFTQV